MSVREGVQKRVLLALLLYQYYYNIGLNAFLTPYVCHGSNFDPLLKNTFQPPNFAPFCNS